METGEVADHRYASGDTACRCCGEPIGPNSAAARYGRMCFACADLKFVQYAERHDSERCGRDREAVIAIHERTLPNDPTVWGRHSLPSGREIEATPPAESAR